MLERKTRLKVGSVSPSYITESVEFGESGTTYAGLGIENGRLYSFAICIGGHPVGAYAADSDDEETDLELYHIFMNTSPWRAAYRRESIPRDFQLDFSVQGMVLEDGFEAEYELKPDDSPTPIVTGFPADRQKEEELVSETSRVAAEVANFSVPEKWDVPEELLEEYENSPYIEVFDFPRGGEDLPRLTG